MKNFFLLFAVCCLPMTAHAQNEWVLQPYIEVTGTRALQELGKNVTGFMGSFPNNPFNVAVSEVGQTGLYAIHSPNDKMPKAIYIGENVVHGDFNGDRYTDFAIWQNRNSYPTDTVIVYFGNATGVDTTRKVVIASEAQYTFFGPRKCVGDINGDGFEDLVITAPGFANDQGKVYIYLGNPSFDSIPDFVIFGEHPKARLGVRCAIGDLNNDHFADLVIRGFDISNPSNKNWFDYLDIYFGGAPFDTTKDLTSIKSFLNGPTQGLSIFDTNGDNIADLLWTYRDDIINTFKIFIHLGGNDFSARFRNGPDFIIPNPDSLRVGISGFGNEIANAGDMNGDGDDDIVIGAYNSFQGGGFVFVYTAGRALDSKFDAAKGQAVEGQFGFSLASSGDVNGDELSDIIVGAPDWRFLTRQGYWGIFLGDRRIPTSVQVKTQTPMPTNLQLSQNYPNPFNAGTNIQFSIPQSGWVHIQIFDITGKQVRVLVNAHHKIGDYTITWDGRDEQGRFCASGVYFSKLSLSPEKGGESQSITQKLVLTR